HLGCAVTWNDAEDRFPCPGHGSLYAKGTAVVLRTPAPKPLQLFHIAENAEGDLVVDTNPFRIIDRTEGRFDPSVIEITDSSYKTPSPAGMGIGALRRAISSRTIGATFVPKSSIERSTVSRGSVPTLIWMRNRSSPKSSCSYRIFAAISSGPPMRFAPRGPRSASN